MIYLERREPAHNRQRFTPLTVAQTLFGSWTLIRSGAHRASRHRPRNLVRKPAATAIGAARKSAGKGKTWHHVVNRFEETS